MQYLDPRDVGYLMPPDLEYKPFRPGRAQETFPNVLLRHRHGWVMGHATVTLEIEWDAGGEWAVKWMRLSSEEMGTNDHPLILIFNRMMHVSDAEIFQQIEQQLGNRLVDFADRAMDGE